MGKKALPKFESMLDESKLRLELRVRNINDTEGAKLVGRQRGAGFANIISGKAEFRVTDLTQLLVRTGIRLRDIVKDEYLDLL